MAENFANMGIDYLVVMPPIEGDATNKNLLSMRQLTQRDILDYIEEAYAAEATLPYGIDLLPRRSLTALMRQPSTRTGGSFDEAIEKLGGIGRYRGGMESSSEAKGETRYDSVVALGTQNDMIAERTAEELGPHFAAFALHREFTRKHLPRIIPVINAGDGRNEHPTQTLGDFFTVHKEFGQLAELKVAIVGDFERYRAAHSLMIGAATVGMSVITVESNAAPLPIGYEDLLGDALTRTTDLDAAMEMADVLYVCRNPDEYTGDNAAEKQRSQKLAKDYEGWTITKQRLQIMPEDAIVLHPRPRNTELHPSVDSDKRVRDVQQMEDVKIMRIAIVARHFGKSIAAAQ